MGDPTPIPARPAPQSLPLDYQTPPMLPGGPLPLPATAKLFIVGSIWMLLTAVISNIDPFGFTKPIALAFLILAFLVTTSGLIALAQCLRRPDRRLAFLGVGLLVTAAGFALGWHDFNRARVGNRGSTCASNLRQIGQAILLYANENDGSYPLRLEDLLLTQEIGSEVMICPASSDTKALGATPEQVAADLSKGGHLSYIYIGQGLNKKTVGPKTIVIYEPLTNHGGEGIHVLYGDGHVTWQDKKEATVILSKLAASHNPPPKSK